MENKETNVYIKLPDHISERINKEAIDYENKIWEDIKDKPDREARLRMSIRELFKQKEVRLHFRIEDAVKSQQMILERFEEETARLKEIIQRKSAPNK